MIETKQLSKQNKKTIRKGGARESEAVRRRGGSNS